MKYFILDDDPVITKILEDIIELKNLGDIVGISQDSVSSIPEIISKKPDIVLIDLLMPNKDGISVVKDIKVVNPKTNFVMISQVSDKDMVCEAYQSGIEFFITKPLNIIEVESVLEKVSEKINMERVFSEIKGMFNLEKQAIQSSTKQIQQIKHLLNLLGMLGEKGTKDIICFCEYLINSNLIYQKESICTYAHKLGEEPRILKQRIRRAIKKGLTNVSNLGIEDYSNEIFVNYSNLVFDFESIKAEMDFIRGKKTSGGRPSVDKFLEGLLLFSED